MDGQVGLIPMERIERAIILIRGEKVMLDCDLAEIYGVETKRLNEQVGRNLHRFPSDFMFRLTPKEAESLRSQIATSNAGRGGRRYLPHAFTEHGALMLANVLNSERAGANERASCSRFRAAAAVAVVQRGTCPQAGIFGEEIRYAIQSGVRRHPQTHDPRASEAPRNRISCEAWGRQTKSQQALNTGVSGYQLSTMNSQLTPVQIKEKVDFEEELAAVKN